LILPVIIEGRNQFLKSHKFGHHTLSQNLRSPDEFGCRAGKRDRYIIPDYPLGKSFSLCRRGPSIIKERHPVSALLDSEWAISSYQGQEKRHDQNDCLIDRGINTFNRGICQIYRARRIDALTVTEYLTLNGTARFYRIFLKIIIAEPRFHRGSIGIFMQISQH